MKIEKVAGLTLFYPPGEEETARLIRTACEKSAHLIQTRWSMATPADCLVYVMTSWWQFLFHSAPWYMKPYLITTYPFLALRVRSIWRYAGGWAIRYGHRQVVGIKPTRLLNIPDRHLGAGLLIEDRSEDERIQTVTCHELVHAFTFHLKLPAWLREGLATLAMEHYLGRRIVSQESVATLSNLTCAPFAGVVKKLNMKDPRALVQQYVVSYWLVRHMEETKPQLLNVLLSKPHKRDELEKLVYQAYGKPGWDEIVVEARNHYC